MTTPATQVCSLTDPSLQALAQGDKLRVRQLANRIPENLHGLFRVLLAFDAEHGLTLGGLQMQPNPALNAMNALQTAGGMRPSLFLHNSDSLTERMRFSVAEIDAMLAGDAGTTEPYYDDAAARSTESRGGINYAGTFSLPNALRNPRLAASERVLLERVSANIDGDLRGAFYCDLTRQDGQLRVARIAIDPLHTLDELNRMLFKPAAALRHSAWGHTELFNHLQITSSIDRGHLDAALAQLGKPGRMLD